MKKACDAYMRKIFVLSLLVFIVFGCATIPKGPLQSDEMRLIALGIAETGNKEGGGKLYKATIQYQHGNRISPAAISSVCTSWNWFWEH
jgi:hypothetical protein